MAPRLPVLLEACPAAAAGAELPVVAGAPAANGSVWEGTPWYPRFLYETKQQVQKKWKKKSGRCGCLARTVRTRLFSAMRALPLARATVSPVASVQPGGWAGLALLVQCSLPPLVLAALPELLCRREPTPWKRG